MRPSVFNPTRVDLRSSKSSDRKGVKGINLFHTILKGPKTSHSRFDVADWRAKPKEVATLSMKALKQCVVQEFGSGSASDCHQNNGKNIIDLSECDNLGGLSKSDKHVAAMATMQPALETQVGADPLSALASRMIDVGELRELVKGTLDVETADLVRKRNIGQNFESKGVLRMYLLDLELARGRIWLRSP